MADIPRVVLLNGVGSSGKTSIAKALQEITTELYLHVQMDTFLEMLPSAYQNHPDSFIFETLQTASGPEVAITAGINGHRLIHGMRHAIAALASQGNNLIVDDVLTDDGSTAYAELLSAFDLITIGVLAPLDVLESREASRGDRMIGLARWQFHRVHQGMIYDLEVDTSRASPIACAELIKRQFRL